jgi:hypothetical protein
MFQRAQKLADLQRRIEVLESAPIYPEAKIMALASSGAMTAIQAANLKGIAQRVETLEKLIPQTVGDSLLELPNRVDNLSAHLGKRIKDLEENLSEAFGTAPGCWSKVQELDNRVKDFNTRINDAVCLIAIIGSDLEKLILATNCERHTIKAIPEIPAQPAVPAVPAQVIIRKKR